MELVFEGLDTYADVYLNDECILKADNMFRCWSIPVRQYIREENNILKVYFHSPVKIASPNGMHFPTSIRHPMTSLKTGACSTRR